MRKLLTKNFQRFLFRGKKVILNKRSGIMAALLLLSTSMFAAEDPEVVTMEFSDLASLKWIAALLVLVLIQASWIILMMRAKDPQSFTLLKFLDFSGKHSPDPETGHTYDGVRELDNPIPAWLNLLMYGGVIFGVFYVLHYHVWKTGPLQIEEYEIEMAAAAEKYKDVELSEDAVKFLSDGPSLEAGKVIFAEKCAACHLNDGGGSVGPNLTDRYWLHGGGIKDIYKTVTNGVPEKGMISWSKQLTSRQRLEVSSFILNLDGTQPAVPKAPEGELYNPDGEGSEEGDPVSDLPESDSVPTGK